MSSRKGLELVVALSHRLDDLADRVQIELIGGATLWSDYSALLRGLNTRVATYHGELPHADVQERLQTSAALLVPSRFEPGSIVTGEALASGLPVVLSTAVGPSDLIGGSAGRVFADGDIGAFEAATRDLLEEIDRDPARFDRPPERSRSVTSTRTRSSTSSSASLNAHQLGLGPRARPRPNLSVAKGSAPAEHLYGSGRAETDVSPGACPTLGSRTDGDRDRRYEQRYRQRAGATKLAAAIAPDRRVADRPFAGTVLDDALAAVDAAPREAAPGSCEEEQSDVFVDAVTGDTRTFVDVGCADGYYAVGMAWSSPRLTTYAYDIAGAAAGRCDGSRV